MTSLNKNLVQHLRSHIRKFEDRKITAADLSREIYYVAREVNAESEAPLRRSLEFLANRVSVLVEQSRVEQVHDQILNTVDEIESELGDWGY
jgi:hypothetical protein